MQTAAIGRVKLSLWAQQFSVGQWLLAWIVIRTLMWTIAITLGHPNAQIDMMEWGSWGGVFQWGYPKHPPLPGWLAGLCLQIAPGKVWGMYLGGYVCAAACLVAAWKLAQEFMSPRRAALAALCLDGLPYLANDPSDFSNNIVTNVFWAFSGLSIFKALQTQRMIWWLAVGVSVGLAILTKYTIGVLLIPLAVFTLVDSNARQSLFKPGLYVSMAVALAIASPHLAWLVQHDFITLEYIAERSASAPSFWAHLKNPITFLVGQAVMLAPVLFIVFPILGQWGPAEDVFKRRFLHACVLGPVVVFLLLSLATGCQLRMIWATPLWVFSGVWFLANFPTWENSLALQRSLRRWGLLVVSILTFAVGYQWAEPYLLGTAGRTLFPGQALTKEITRQWHERYQQPFPIVGGEPWLAGNVCCYSPYRPALYSSGSMGYFVMEARHTPWTNDADLMARGGVLVWDADMYHENVLQQIRARFPTAEVLPIIELPYQTRANVKPARVGVAFVAPAK